MMYDVWHKFKGPTGTTFVKVGDAPNAHAAYQMAKQHGPGNSRPR